MRKTGRPPRGEAHTPAVEDPRWKEWAEPLYAFLSQPRAWEEINQWRDETKVMGPTRLRHCMAWLEGEGRVWCYDWIGVTHWAQAGQLAAAANTLDDILRDHHAKESRDSPKAYRRHVEPVDKQQNGSDDGTQENDDPDDLQSGDHDDTW